MNERLEKVAIVSAGAYPVRSCAPVRISTIL
jgi:hypothetical protein